MINRGLLLIYCQKGDHSNPHATTVLRMESNIQAAVKIFFVAFWVPFFTLAENQECLKKDINFENTLKSDLLEKYKTGQSVKLSCATGYVGVLRLECENGIWKKVGGRECKKRPCGHPGDTPNGDFKLVRESEFVFGATVEYTCRTGYIMASRVNYRNCRSQGWDNAVPVCEVVKCPIISNLGDVIATGNTEEASYSDVIHFECASPNKMLSGPQDIHCKDDGRWSGDIPKCIEIKCLPPEIPHGFTNPDQEYKENNILQYRCERGYNPRSGTPRCTKYGWSIKPECEEIICLLGSPTNSVVSTNPRGKNIFKAGEHVEIICSRDHWVFGTKQESRTIECQENGKWEFRPVCEEITCEYPHGQHLSYPQPYYRPVYKLRERMWYKCEHGYQSKATTATCTENGWEPKPLCTESTCQKPEIAHGEVVGMLKDTYKLNEQIEIQCDRGYKPEKFAATCTQNGEWDKMQNCKLVKCPIISNLGDVIATGNTEEASYSDVIHFECASPNKLLVGPEHIHCKDNGQWSDDIPKCIEIKCLPPEIPHGFTNPDQEYKENNILQYRCERGYNPRSGTPRCTKYGWSIKPECEEIICLLGSPTNSVVSTNPRGKNIFKVGEHVEIICSRDYWVFGTKQESRTIECQENGKWEVRPVCEEITCEYPHGQHLSYPQPYYRPVYKLRERMWYKCEHGYQSKATTATCTENGWEPKPLCTESTCQKPEIAHGEVVGMLKDTYKLNEQIEIQCDRGYKPEKFAATCTQNGEWDKMQNCKLHLALPSPLFL
ncbi:complement factor H isoform X4 [Pangasianodon hypophthalmus]|uniref:complement factor H isoform X4 n=1 Tax=Pangasianodon hypophthalmus TaxID=310915 RepID=UPI0023074981|nr:complement factor H isoform X4 [Pangasianodon hypophthalmus]